MNCKLETSSVLFTTVPGEPNGRVPFDETLSGKELPPYTEMSVVNNYPIDHAAYANVVHTAARSYDVNLNVKLSYRDHLVAHFA